MERDFKGVWIPKEIWLNKELNANEKVLLSEINSLDNKEHCIASNEYFSEFLGVSVPTVTRAIKKLSDLGYITTENIDGRHRVIKMISQTNQNDKDNNVPNQNDEADSSKRLTNNIVNNKNQNILLSKDNNISENASKFSFGKPQSKKSNMYETCLGMIYSFTNNIELQDSLIDYLNLRLEMKNEKPFYGANQWKGLLNKLSELSSDSKEMNDIVKQSILKGWGGFFKLESENGGGYKQDKKSPYIFIEHTVDDTGVNHNLSGKKY